MTVPHRNYDHRILKNAERGDFGVIANLVSLDGTREMTFEGVGIVPDAARQIAAYCDKHDLLVTCLSTPETIHHDLQARRGYMRGFWPEWNILKLIGRTDLIHPRIGGKAA
jgi:hypothetical protein